MRTFWVPIVFFQNLWVWKTESTFKPHHRLRKVFPYNKTMESTKQNAPISDRKFASIELMRTNVLEKARERGLKIEAKINSHFDEILKRKRER